VTDGFYQSVLLAAAHGVVVVDAPPTIGHNLLRAIKQVTAKTGTPSTVTHLVYSHFHADHIGASSIFGDDVVRVGHVENRRLLREAGDPNRPAPTLTFKERHVLEFGTDRLELAYHGPNHTPDNIFIYAPKQQTLMVVDVLSQAGCRSRIWRYHRTFPAGCEHTTSSWTTAGRPSLAATSVASAFGPMATCSDSTSAIWTQASSKQ
jgi:glyoxylase-like metal-dependent hydrolase (beta-lactamase superfamily II)